MEQKDTQKQKTNLCAAAKRFQTKGEAFQHLNANKNNVLYLIEEIVNGQLKQSCYGRCCNSVHDGELCHIHRNQQKREKSIFLNYEKDIKNKCDNNKIKIANSSSPYFEKVSKNKKKKTILDYFDNKDDPIYLILHDKTEHLNSLRLYATKLLQSSTDLKTEKNDIEFIENKKSSNSKLIDSINHFKKDYEESNNSKKNVNKSLKSMLSMIEDDVEQVEEAEEFEKMNEVNEDEHIDLNDLNDLIDDSASNVSISTQEILEFETEELSKIDETEKLKSSHEIQEDDADDEIQEDDSDDEESHDVDPIYTNKGKLLYLDAYSMDVIEPEGENDGTCIGILYKVNKKYSTIERNNEYYTVLSQNKLIHESEEYYRDVLNDRIFQFINDEFIFKGRVSKKNNSNSYKFHLD